MKLHTATNSPVPSGLTRDAQAIPGVSGVPSPEMRDEPLLGSRGLWGAQSRVPPRIPPCSPAAQVWLIPGNNPPAQISPHPSTLPHLPGCHPGLGWPRGHKDTAPGRQLEESREVGCAEGILLLASRNRLWRLLGVPIRAHPSLPWGHTHPFHGDTPIAPMGTHPSLP